ncbi:ankyrin, partial [Paraphaeosphaeria sporulosa]
MLLDKGANVNAQGGPFAYALQAASAGGHEAVVKMLLDKGADINVQGGRCHGNALQAASAVGHEAVLKVLLDKGADVNAQGGHYGNALQAAS